MMYISICVCIPAHRHYAKLRVPGAEGTPGFTAPFSGRARLKFPDPKPCSRSRARRRRATGSFVLPSEEPGPERGLEPGLGAVPAARALWRGAPCPAAAELRRAAAGQPVPGRGPQGRPRGGGAVAAGRSRPAAGR